MKQFIEITLATGSVEEVEKLMCPRSVVAPQEARTLRPESNSRIIFSRYG